MQAEKYSNLNGSGQDNSSPWLEQQMKEKKRASVMWIYGSIAALLVVVGLGVGLGVGLSRKSGGSSGSSGSGSGSSSDGSMVTIPGTAGVVKADPNDPSKFEKDSRLKNSFYGFAYTPWAHCSLIAEPPKPTSPKTFSSCRSLRPHSSLCIRAAPNMVKNGTSYALADVNEDDTAYTRQRDLIKDAITTYGTDHIAGVTVGNEFILNSVTAAGETTATGTAGLAAAHPVGTSDAGAYFNTPLLQAIDYGLANVHPWFANTTIDDAATWTYDFFQQTNVAQAATVSNNPTMYIAETGWPTKTNGASAASVPNLQIFLDTFVCASNTNQTKYFFFEFKDEPWKDVMYGGVEGWWGLFDSDKKLKDVTIPDCSHS
ncbi:glycosyl hydrolase 17 family [Rhizoctonia solani]|uniref:glucan endo-1,3-beta-D-glucosidase n=1 Tax=Rhizoctonia solani TaxID=456999 RepID=A0A8H7M6P5_9AGAM|nr:glycosyl hydrolase 17 family [Rhizoctonia solani]